MTKTFPAALAAALLVLAGTAHAAGAVVWDQGPTTGTLEDAYSNTTQGTNWADSVTLSKTTAIGGLTYYSDFDLSAYTASDAFHLKILADDHGIPGATLLAEDIGYSSISSYSAFTMPVLIQGADGQPVWDVEDFGMQTLHFDFPAFTMQAGTTYWVGLSGNGFEAAEWGIAAPQDDAMAEFLYNPATGHDDFVAIETGAGGVAPIGDQMFQLLAVPEPAQALMLAGGLGLLAAARRRRARR